MIALQQWLLRHWYPNSSAKSPTGLAWPLLSAVLVPFSWLTTLVSRARVKKIQKRSKVQAHRPIIVVVGNLVAGGAGKTPIVMALRDALAPHFGSVGVIARGFHDEAAQLKRGNKGPVFTHPERARALQALTLASPSTQVVISDDGLQHVGLVRDIELLVIDPRGLGNGRLLPAGPLRESSNRINSVDAVLLSNWEQAPSEHPCASVMSQQRVFACQTKVLGFYRLSLPTAPRRLSQLVHPGMRIGAAAAIAQPAAFFKLLSEQLVPLGIELAPQNCLALADHAPLSTDQLDTFRVRQGLDALIITEKDAMKCLPSTNPNIWAMAIASQLPAELVNYLVAQITQGLHGHALS
jgi:tetraacyldisaccharide 4'-kinase